MVALLGHSQRKTERQDVGAMKPRAVAGERVVVEPAIQLQNAENRCGERSNAQMIELMNVLFQPESARNGHASNRHLTDVNDADKSDCDVLPHNGGPAALSQKNDVHQGLRKTSFKEPSGNTIICVTRAMQWLYAITLRNHSAARLFA